MAADWFEEAWKESLAREFLRLMEWRFGDVPETARTRVTGASLSELDAWGKAFVEAMNLEEFMACAPHRH